MSATEQPQVEAKSSVKISMNAKGEAIVEVKAYDGVYEEELDRIHELAVRIYKQTADAVRVQAQS